jgi:nucleotide-binding universal stress UspA family protein
MKIFTYIEDTPLCPTALRTAGRLAQRLGADLAVLTSRTGTVVSEPEPPLGRDLPRDQWDALPPGLALLTRALAELEGIGVLTQTEAIRIREETGDVRVFRVAMAAGRTATFQVCFGPPLPTIQAAVEGGDDHDLLVIADPGKKGLHRVVTTNLAHRTALDTMISVLAVKGDHLDSRVILCADGSKSARRAYPLLRQLLPALGGRVDILGVHERLAANDVKETCVICAERARTWLTNAGKESTIHIKEGESAVDVILAESGDDALIVLGASLRSDLARRLKGSVPMHVMEKSRASVLLVKALPEEEMPL